MTNSFEKNSQEPIFMNIYFLVVGKKLTQDNKTALNVFIRANVRYNFTSKKALNLQDVLSL